MAAEAARLGALRDLLKLRLESALERTGVNGSLERRLPGNLNMSFAGVHAGALLTSLPDVALSTAPPAPRRPRSPAMSCARWAWERRPRVPPSVFGLGRVSPPKKRWNTPPRA